MVACPHQRPKKFQVTMLINATRNFPEQQPVFDPFPAQKKPGEPVCVTKTISTKPLRNFKSNFVCEKFQNRIGAFGFDELMFCSFVNALRRGEGKA